MSTVPSRHKNYSGAPLTSWAVAELFPEQGGWSEADYLDVTNGTNRLVELTDGFIEVLPMPTTSHQLILQFIYGLLLSFVNERQLGLVCLAGIRLRVRPEMFRQPDLLFVSRNRYSDVADSFWEFTDLAMEVVSNDAGSRDRDYRQKREDYAEGLIPEYWIIDPQLQLVTVLVLVDGVYEIAGEYSIGNRAVSVLLPEFSVEVQELFAAADFRK